MPDTLGPDELAPRQPRQNVLLSAEICGFDGGAPTKHRVRDLSSTGARVDHAGSFRVGATVLISVGVLDHIGATVMWVRDDSAGLRFAEPIDPEAARSKALVSNAQKPAPPRGSPGAGWIFDLNDPHRK